MGASPLKSGCCIRERRLVLSVTFGGGVELLKQLRRIEIRTQRLANEQLSGTYSSVFKGQGLSFREVRAYLPGDDVRWIDWNVDHIAKHGVTPEEAEEVVRAARSPWPDKMADNKSGVHGQTNAGRWLQVIFIADPDKTVFVIHARPLTERERSSAKRRRR